MLIASCGQRSTTVTTQTTNPNTGQVTTQTQTTTDDYGMNGSYQVYNNGGQQYAVTMINGQQMYVPYNIFQQQMALGGYNALNDYYYSQPSYFHSFVAGAAGWAVMNSLCGNYGGYYRSHNINTYNTYHVVHVRQAPAMSGRNYNGGNYNNNSSGMRSGSYNNSSYGNRPVNNSSGMRSGGNTMSATNNSSMRSNTGSGMRSSGGGMRSSGMRSGRR